MAHKTLIAAVLAAGCSLAHATITFNGLTTSNEFDYVDPVVINGFTFSNDCSSGASCLGVWSSSSAFTMDHGAAALFVNYGFSTTTMTSSAGTFDFYSIDLADVYNQGASSTIEFHFVYAAGGSSTQSVTLDSQVGGQTFVFGQRGLTRVSWQTTSGDDGWGQFDNVNVSAVPEPASLAMMLAGLGAVGAAVRRQRA